MHGCGALRLGQPRVTDQRSVGCRVDARHPRSADIGIPTSIGGRVRRGRIVTASRARKSARKPQKTAVSARGSQQWKSAKNIGSAHFSIDECGLSLYLYPCQTAKVRCPSPLTDLKESEHEPHNPAPGLESDHTVHNPGLRAPRPGLTTGAGIRSKIRKQERPCKVTN